MVMALEAGITHHTHATPFTKNPDSTTPARLPTAARFVTPSPAITPASSVSRTPPSSISCIPSSSTIPSHSSSSLRLQYEVIKLQSPSGRQDFTLLWRT
ncbi:hypothetical protein D9757_008716 [Collybiopsis confluens]|uniref:Uncharacterized protein n=1 Tax=Collybiopsis confluens TaxID=2823264 RepID=A0A8H5M2Z3_9AGAR|nr:hypothetical protein D9757_008716 [Collybiopsis confluens]